jgi:hypothetical protein
VNREESQGQDADGLNMMSVLQVTHHADISSIRTNVQGVSSGWPDVLHDGLDEAKVKVGSI